MNRKIIRRVAVLSIVFGVIHFIGETLWHFKFGQFLPMLIVDYIAVTLLLFGAYKALKNHKAVGLLCGAWGFEFCLNYRTLFNRVDKMLHGNGIGDPAVDVTAYVLAGLLVVSIFMFLISMYLSIPKKEIENE